MFLLFNITNPFRSFLKNFWRYRWYWDKKLSSHKWFEIEAFIDGEHLIELQLDLRFRGRDHAGPSIELVLFCLAINLKIYDHRHWNYKANRWENHNWWEDGDENI